MTDSSGPVKRHPHPRAVLTLTALCLCAVTPAAVGAVERQTVTEIRPLLIRAAAQGVAHGRLTGTGSAYLQRRFDTASPIDIDVQRLHLLPQPGCARLQVTTHQRDVLVSGKRDVQELVYQLSFCADGRFPGER
jgi:hypothetical protein